MIYNIVAFPGRFPEWCEQLLLEFAHAAAAPKPSRSKRSRSAPEPQGAPPEVALIFGDSLAQIGRELLTRQCADAIIVSRQPHSDTCQALKDMGRPFLLALDNPETAVNALMKDHQFTYPHAVRMLAASSASLFQLVLDANALVMRPDRAVDLAATARTIARHFSFQLDGPAMEAILACPKMQELAHRVLETPAPVTSEQLANRKEVPALMAADLVSEDPFGRRRLTPILQGAIEPFWRALQGEKMDDVIWGRELFFNGDNPAENATSPVSLTGPSRCLLFGPYLRLPGGSWSCQVVFACNERAVGTQMMADVYAASSGAVVGSILSRAQFQLSEPGIFEIEFSFSNESADLPVEVRLFNTSSALDGHIALGEVRLSPLEFKRLPVTQ